MQQTLKNFVSSRITRIILHFAAWTVFFFFPFIFYRIKILDSAFFAKQFINVAFLSGFFYLNMLYLIPAYLGNRKFTAFVFAILTCIILIVLQQYLVEYLFDSGSLKQFQIISPHHENAAPGNGETISHTRRVSHARMYIMPEIIRQGLLSSFFIFLLSGSIKIGREWFREEKLRKELENQHLNAELSLLKSQVNPHFLFNTLNTIYSLAHKKSDLTKKAIMMLADMMRYMIVESSGKEVPLEREIQYLSDYISLQKLRLSREITINFRVEPSFGSTQPFDPIIYDKMSDGGQTQSTRQYQDIMLAPMVLITFVENAFKHGISYLGKSFINIFLRIDDKQIEFTVENSLSGQSKDSSKESGHGLENTRKRLALLYPGKHILESVVNGDKYYVRLIILLRND